MVIAIVIAIVLVESVRAILCGMDQSFHHVFAVFFSFSNWVSFIYLHMHI
jgi:hypothetical protein